MPVDAPPPVEIVVTGPARLPEAAGDPAFSIVKLGGAELRSSPRLDEVLETVPGVSLFRRNSSLGANPTTQGVSLRGIAGSGASRALVTLDGVPQNDPFGGWVIWSGIAPDRVQAVTVVRGAGAGPYGAGALTGTIDLAARTAIQVHGAMGYSWEVDVHFFLKRALALNTWWGTPGAHRARVAERVLGGRLGPDQLFATEAVHA